MVSAVFNISIFSVYFLYMLLHILLLFASLETERAQSARRGRQIRDVTVSIDYRVYETHEFIV